jgi:BirA family transcriptional regulator, biotin operon repressor / biotin---[acetyl-CoA-carboxylase] ligase
MSRPLTPDAIRAHSSAAWIGGRIECLETVDSTNSRARQLGLAGAPDGTVVVAEEQTAGRGRLGRSWVSPRGRNLYLSILLRTGLAADLLSQLSLTAGLAACETLGEWCAATLKWPNDVLVGGRKAVGILAELEVRDGQRFVVLGIGVNVNMRRSDLPDDLLDKATSLAIESGAEVDRARVAGRLLGCLEERYEQLHRSGFAEIAAEWTRLSGFVGRQIRVAEPGGVVAGEVIGLAPDGALCLKREDGREHRVVAGDVTVLGGYER